MDNIQAAVLNFRLKKLKKLLVLEEKILIIFVVIEQAIHRTSF